MTTWVDGDNVKLCEQEKPREGLFAGREEGVIQTGEGGDKQRTRCYLQQRWDDGFVIVRQVPSIC
jgi:hypothetical protein